MSIPRAEALLRRLPQVTGCRIRADESGRLAEDGAGGLEKILGGVDEIAQLVAQIARASDEQLAAGQHVAQAINTTAAQARQATAAAVEQAAAVRDIVRSTGSMRTITQQVSRAMAEQALLYMGRSAKEYLDEQKARAASPEPKAAIDRIWKKICEEEPRTK